MKRQILDQNGLNFLTLTIVEWVDLFSRREYCEILIDSLKYCQKEKGLIVHAYVIMSNHIHLIVRTDDETGLSPILKSFKSHTAKAFLTYLKDYNNIESRRDWLLNRFSFNARKNNTKSQYQIWQRGNHPTSIYSPRVILTKLNYIHNNPVAAGIVNKSKHYRYSSASNYENKSGILDVSVIDITNADEIGYVDVGF